MPKQMTAEMAHAVYDILVEECGAEDREAVVDRQSFIYSQTEAEYFVHEYRFCGALGFGGKFWVDQDHLYVSCYPEDETSEIWVMIKKANECLAEVQKAFDYSMY